MSFDEGLCREPMKLFLRVMARCETMKVFSEKTDIAVGTAQSIKMGATGIGKAVLAKLIRFEEENPGDGFFYANEGTCWCGVSLKGRQGKVRFCSHKCQRKGKENG
jgi:hypothetical protein